MDNLTETAKEIITEARELTSLLNHSYITNEHILQIMIHRESCLAWPLMMANRPILGLMKQELQAKLIPNESELDLEGFDDHAKKAIERAFIYADSFQFKQISSALILLGIMDSGSQISQYLLKNWSMDLEILQEEVKEYGDIDTPNEVVELRPSIDLRLLRLSDHFTPDLTKIIKHSMELSRTFKNNRIGFSHLLLSLTFLTLRNVIDVTPIDKSLFDLNIVKTLVAADLTGKEPFMNDLFVFSPDVQKLFSIAIQEAYLFGHDEMGLTHLCIAMAQLYPEQVAKGLSLDYLDLRRHLFEYYDHQKSIQSAMSNNEGSSNPAPPSFFSNTINSREK